jgi:hypothetical protein
MAALQPVASAAAGDGSRDRERSFRHGEEVGAFDPSAYIFIVR